MIPIIEYLKIIFLEKYPCRFLNGFSIYFHETYASIIDVMLSADIKITEGSSRNFIRANANKGWCHKYAE